MRRYQALLMLCASVGAISNAADFSGGAALEYTRKAVSFGPRPPGSAANLKLQEYIQAQLKTMRCTVSTDAFTASTPVGPVPMKNIIARFAGRTGRSVVFTGHFDTKSMPGRNFVGANDGGASTGLLLELARAVNVTPHANDIYIVWFDGEEAFGPWSSTDGAHGSRHLADKWASAGMLSKIKALINVDMIGDKDLEIIQEGNSSTALRELVWKVAADLGYGKHFMNSGFATEDDHLAFLRYGVNALDLIDFDYGPNNAYWHTDQDTMDKLSANSLQVVGRVLMETLRRLEK